MLLYQKAITARFRPSNWLVRMAANGLFTQFRSYLNCHFSAEDYTVVFLPYADIRSAKLVNELQHLPDRDDSQQPTETTRRRRLIEIEFCGDSRQLAIAMANERDTVLAKTRIGTEKPSTRYHHLPVRRRSPTCLEIEWNVVPNAAKFLNKLSRYTVIYPNENNSTDLANYENLSREEQESRLLRLAESGDVIGALAMSRKLYSYDLTQAREFVGALLNRKSASS